MLEFADRYAFGANWQRYLKTSFSTERVGIAQDCLLGFLKLDRLDGLGFLDIGSGSGIHSLAAWRSGAAEVVSLDLDPQSIAAIRSLHASVGAPANWRIVQGSILDGAFCAGLGRFDIVYAWGVLHHTGDQWQAFANAVARLKPGGRFHVALYSSDVHLDPSPEAWLEIKRRYNAAGSLERGMMEARHVWASVCGRRLANLWRLPRIARDYRASRGMAFMTDVRDWLGGWPMEFSSTAEVMRRATDDHDLVLVNIASGEANSEFLFVRRAEANGLPVVDAEMAIPPPPLRALTDLPARPFFIFGTARGAELLVERLERRGGPTLAGFIDIERTGSFHGRPVLSVEAFAAGWPSDTPVALSNRHILQNAARLRANGIRAIWNAYPLVTSLHYWGS